MKKQGEKRRGILRPSPNEAANILQSEKEKRKKIRLKQIREQEKAFSRQVLEDARRRKTIELKHLTSHLKSQWEQEHNEKQSALEKKYHENLAEVGLGHKTASEDQTNYNKPELTEDEKKRATERYQKALEQLMYDRAKSTQSERERAEARQQALEIERLRAAKIAALPPPVDPIEEIYVRKDHKNSEQKNVESYSMSRFHLRPSVHVERDLDPNQEDARQAAKDEEERIQVIIEEVQRDKAEQIEKARLRHKHALAQLQLEEDHKKLMEELDQLERHDRQRRQDAVAKIPVRIFQPPHKRLEDAEDRQRDLEQAFEDMYMMQTGYMGDLTVALEPPEHLRLASDDNFQSESDKGSTEPEGDREQPPQRIPAVPGPDRSSERAEHGREQEKEPEEAPLHDRAPKAPSEDPLRRLLQRIERQRDQWRRRQPAEEAAQPPAAESTGIPRTLPSTVPPTKKQEYRVPDTIPFSSSPESLAEAELSEEEVEDSGHETPGMAVRPRLHEAPDIPRSSRLQDRHTVALPEHETDTPHPAVSSPRTLLHPLEAAQRSRTTTPSGSASTAQLTQQEALLEQEKLKLKLQQQTLLQQQLEEQLQDYQRQLADIYGPAEAPRRPLGPGIGAFERGSLEEPPTGGAPYEGASSLADSTMEPFQGPGSIQAPRDGSPQGGVPSLSSQEGSPVMSDGLESSTLGSVTSDETETGLPLEFRRTLAAAQATADKAAELRQREKEVLEELSRVTEDVPYSSRTQSERDSSPGSTSSLRSKDHVSVSTPSTLSLSVTMSSERSVTTVTTRYSQTRPAPHFFDHALPLTSQSRSPFSDVADVASIAAVTSLLTKTSQQIGFSRPLSSVPRPFSVLSSSSELGTRISSVSPSAVSSSLTAAELSSRNPLAPFYSGSTQARDFGVPQSSILQQSRPAYSSVSSSQVTAAPALRNTSAFTSVRGVAGVPQSSAFQQSSPGYSPGYLDYYHQKIEEERQLFEEQRNRIRRYSDLFKKSSQESPGTQTYLTPVSISKTVPSADLHGSVPTYLKRNVGTIGLDTNKENQGYIANSAGFGGQDRLRDISQRLGTFEKSLTTSVSSTVVTSSSFVSKPLSTSEWSYGSSKTEYMSLPRQTAGLGLPGSAGSTLSSLSELTEMMTRLTSTSDESEEKSSKDGAIGGQKLTDYAPKMTTKMGLGSQGHLTRGPAKETYVPSIVGPLDVARSYALTGNTSTKLSGTQEAPVNAPGSRWTKGSDGKQWFMLSRSSTLSSVGGVLGKDNIASTEEGEDNVFPDAREDKSPVSGSVESGSTTSLPSSPLPTDTAEKLDESFSSGEAHGRSPSTLSPASNDSHKGSSQSSDFHGDFSHESNTGK